MFRRRNSRGRSFGRGGPTFDPHRHSPSYKDQDSWEPIEHFAYAYLYFIDVSEDAIPVPPNPWPEGDVFAKALMTWFPEECIIDETIDAADVFETILNHRRGYEGDQDAVFNNSLSFIKDWFGNDKEKLEIMLDEIWELVASDNKMTEREKELFLNLSKTFNISVDLE